MRVFVTLFLACLMAGCEDPLMVTESQPPEHFLNTWIGTYYGERTTTSWSIDHPSSSTTFSDTVLVMIADSSAIYVDLTYVPMDTSGYFFAHTGGSNFYSVDFFTTDSVLQSSGSGGLGGGTSSTFRGRRQ